MDCPSQGASATSSIAVCVPVRNEEAHVGQMLDALACQRDPPAFTVCLYLDGCTDGSETIVRGLAAEADMTIVVECDDAVRTGNAGRARAAAMALGMRQVGVAGAALLSTDADSVPAPDWIARCLANLAEVEVAAGRVVTDYADAPLGAARLAAYLDRLYAIRRLVDPVPWESSAAHHYGSGANLAIRAEDYAALGGFQPQIAGEDARLLDDASRAGLAVRRDPRLLVTTSARRAGRVPGGMADVLRALDDGAEPAVGDPAVALWQYRMQAAARRAFAGTPQGLATLGRAIGLTGDHCLGVARDCRNAEAFAMRIVPLPPGGQDLIPLADAERRLAAAEATMIVDAA